MNGQYTVVLAGKNIQGHDVWALVDPQKNTVVTSTDERAMDVTCKELNHLLKMVQESYETQPQAAS